MTAKKLASKTGIYDATTSPLFGIQSKRRLAEVIRWAGAPSALQKFALRPENFSCYWDKSRPGKKPRWIEAPDIRLKGFQKRMEVLLKRIRMPQYLHSGVPGRSYLSNSRAHCDAVGCTVTMDVEDFYGSVTQERVVRLFIVMFGCTRDVAETISCLLCCNGHLATGSPASPLLSFLAYKEIFDRIAVRAEAFGGVFTLYIDDIGLTGNGVGNTDIKWVTRLLQSGGLTVKRSKTRLFHASGAKLVTGRAFRHGKSRAPNSQHLKMKAALDRSTASPKDLSLHSSAVGRVRHVALLDDDRREEMRAMAKSLLPPTR